MESLKASKLDQSCDRIELPPGIRFHPTDEELITHYLSPKVTNSFFSTIAIGEVDVNKCEPWELPGREKMGEKEWYFFCVRDRKYPTGLRANRATESGYWKATGKDKEICRDKILIGMKKTLVFYRGRAPKRQKSGWVMHEYRLQATDSVHNLQKPSKDEWVVCRVFENSGSNKAKISGFELSSSSVLPPLMDSSSPMEDTKLNPSEILSISNSFHPEFSELQNSHFLKLLLENQLLDTKQISISSEPGFSTDLSSATPNHEIGQDDPSTEPVDRDYLWIY